MPEHPKTVPKQKTEHQPEPNPEAAAKRKEPPQPDHRHRLIVEPDDGLEPILGLLALARQTLLIKQFDCREPSIIQAAIAAAARGVEVRVLLNPTRGSGQRDNDVPYEALRSAGVEVAWTPPKFMVTHEKSVVVDGERALISTFNLSPKYLTQTRDYGILTTDPAQVADMVACFDADWQGVAFAPSEGTGLLWSNVNARAVMCAFIDGARTSLDLQHPKFMDTTVLDRVLLAHDRGVRVRMLCGGRHGTSPGDVVDTMSSLRVLQRVGIKVHRQKSPKLHAKLILADGDRALVGSMNIDRVGFDFRRELGLLVTAHPIVSRLKTIFGGDWEASKLWVVPDPMASPAHDPEEPPHDPDFHHE